MVIEVDGATHGDPAEIEHDNRRTSFLRAQVLYIHRIDNIEIFKNLPSALDGIHAVIYEHEAKGPHPALRATFSKVEGTD